MLDAISGNRPAGDILGRICRVTLGGSEYELKVLPIAGNRRWRGELDARFDKAISDAGATPDRDALYAVLSQQADDMLDLIYSYDTASGTREGVLPPRADVEEVAYETELIDAVRAIWMAANPFVVAGIAAAVRARPETPTPPSSKPTSGARRPTAGHRRSSRQH